MAAVRTGKVGVVYFAELSRLARETVIILPILKEIVSTYRCRVIIIADGIDSNVAGWELPAMVRGWGHQEFLTGLRAAVLRGQEEAVLADYSVGDWCFGYTSEPIPGTERGKLKKPRMKYIIHKEHSRWVVEIFTWFVVEGWSLNRIAQELSRLGVPKDQRSTTAGWTHNNVRAVLRNEKYIGIWPWGRETNVRDPLTGRISKEPRPLAETVKYKRERPHLRLVEDEIYFKAQGLLDLNESRLAAVRDPSGTFRGSTRDAQRPRHLLQRVLTCDCGHYLRVGGANGKYLECPRAVVLQCPVRTKVRRDLAEKLILGVIQERLIACPEWKQLVHDWATREWAERQKNRPDEQAAIEAQLVEINKGIERLLDQIEEGEVGSSIRDRLEQRCRERTELTAKLETIRREERQVREAPTRAWVEEQITALWTLLNGACPAAGLALRRLLGDVVVEEVIPADGKPFFRARFKLRVADSLAAAGCPSLQHEDQDSGVSIEVDLVRSQVKPWEALAEPAKALYDQGKSFREIGSLLGCYKNWPVKAVTHWYLINGQESPDFKKEKGRVIHSSKAKRLAPQALELYDKGVPMQEIAVTLGCTRNMATKAVRFGMESRGQVAQDGRTRRKSLPRKGTSPSSNDTTPDQGNEAA
jgi:hypothetical protein